MFNPTSTLIRRTVCIALGASSLALAGAAGAQGYYGYESTTGAAYGPVTDEGGITVYGRPYLNEEHPMLSQSVSYADLDLSTAAGVEELRYRIRQTANDLCARLGEPPAIEQNTTVLPSCRPRPATRLRSRSPARSTGPATIAATATRAR
jgi:hypothetical protein